MSYMLEDNASPAEKLMQLFELSSTLQMLKETKKGLEPNYEIFKLFEKTLPYFYQKANDALCDVNNQIYTVETAITELQKDLMDCEEIKKKLTKVKVTV